MLYFGVWDDSVATYPPSSPQGTTTHHRSLLLQCVKAVSQRTNTHFKQILRTASLVGVSCVVVRSRRKSGSLLALNVSLRCCFVLRWDSMRESTLRELVSLPTRQDTVIPSDTSARERNQIQTSLF
eukprot:PhF_6_TR26341/c0_g1_i1/m.37896